MTAHRQVYLSGPIANVNPIGAQLWREQATKRLLAKGCTVFNPALPHVAEPTIEHVEADITAIMDSAIILAHVPPHIQCCGTAMEIFYASYVMDLPVVVWTGNPFSPCSVWIRIYATNVYPTLEKAIDAVVQRA